MYRRKIAFIHPDLGIGGAERLILDVAGALSKQGNYVYFLTNHFDKNHCFEELKSDKYYVQVFGDWLPRSIFGRFQALCAYIRMIYLTIYYLWYAKDKPDVFFVDLIPISIPFLKYANQTVIYYCHHPDLLASEPGGLLKKIYRKPIDWLELKSTKQADYLLVNSLYTASVFKDTFPEIEKPIEVLYPTISYSYQESLKLKIRININKLIPEIPKDAFVFLSINRFHPAKKIDLVIRAMNNLKSTLDNFKNIFLIIAGGYDPNLPINANYYSELLQFTKDNNLTDNIIFLKSPNDNFKTALLLACDCLVYTPLKEHFGIVPLEAMAAGKPVIAFNSGGPRETIEHGLTGFLAESNPESLSNFMKKMLIKENAINMGIKGKYNLETKFSYNKFCECLYKLINALNKNK